MNKKENKYKKLEKEILYLQKQLMEFMSSNKQEGLIVFRPAKGLSLDEFKKIIIHKRLFDWHAINLDGDVTPTLLEIYETLQLLQNMAQTDPLTGLSNRKRLFQVLNLEVERSHRTNQPMCLFFIDIDDFKKINDTLGHHIGDMVLKEVAKVLKNECRKTDYVFRYGGEEFVILFPSTSLFQGEIMGERIKKTIKELKLKDDRGHTFQITCSIGISCYKGRKKIDPEILIKIADKAMYEAKNTGKDKVVIGGIVDIDLESFEKMVKVNAEEKQFLFSK